MTAPVQSEERYPVADVCYFDLEDTPITLFRRAVANRQNIRITLQSGEALVLLGDRLFRRPRSEGCQGGSFSIL